MKKSKNVAVIMIPDDFENRPVTMDFNGLDIFKVLNATNGLLKIMAQMAVAEGEAVVGKGNVKALEKWMDKRSKDAMEGGETQFQFN